MFVRSTGTRPVWSRSSAFLPAACLAWCLIALRPATPVHAAAGQAVSEPAATAAFLLNFARFTEWPDDPAKRDDALLICAADRDVVDALEATVNGRAAGTRIVATRRLRVDSEPAGCHVLYVGGLDRERVTRLLQAVTPAPVLTVGDQAGFAAAGGGIELFIEDGRMGFLINRRTAERTGLRFSSRLLALARLLKD